MTILLALVVTKPVFADEDFILSLLRGAFDLPRASGAKAIYRTREGKPLAEGELEESCIEHYQTKNRVAVLSSWGGDVTAVLYATRDSTLKLAGGVKIGGPISSVLKPGLIPGKYSKNVDRDHALHTWEGPVYVVTIAEVEGKLANIIVIDEKEWEANTYDKSLITYLP
jgi:hypothetical protein